MAIWYLWTKPYRDSSPLHQHTSQFFNDKTFIQIVDWIRTSLFTGLTFATTLTPLYSGKVWRATCGEPGPWACYTLVYLHVCHCRSSASSHCDTPRCPGISNSSDTSRRNLVSSPQLITIFSMCILHCFCAWRLVSAVVEAPIFPFLRLIQSTLKHRMEPFQRVDGTSCGFLVLCRPADGCTHRHYPCVPPTGSHRHLQHRAAGSDLWERPEELILKKYHYHLLLTESNQKFSNNCYESLVLWMDDAYKRVWNKDSFQKL